ncbi:MAG TPA: chromophore lyase CpcT/CpeT, partial [Polyangiaceae bacterium]|nr:chromophore lyase CpcT/CpeT [Polyangiaceae bacterium]
RSRVFELRAPEAAVGACARPERPRFAAADAAERAGCAVELDWHEGERAFAGSTSGRACPSGLRGASYATSEVRLDAERLVSWDRGYDDAGKQVWGATKGPYEFVRRGERPR